MQRVELQQLREMMRQIEQGGRIDRPQFDAEDVTKADANDPAVSAGAGDASSSDDQPESPQQSAAQPGFNRAGTEVGTSAVVPTEWPAIDHLLRQGGWEDSQGSGGLKLAMVHEWFSPGENRWCSEGGTSGASEGAGGFSFRHAEGGGRRATGDGGDDGPGGAAVFRPGRTASSRWVGPLCVMAHLAHRGWQVGRSSGRGWVIWIGRRCWAHPHVLARQAEDGLTLLEHSIFVDVDDLPSRLWAAETALRCTAAAVVVIDGSGWPMPASRRAQLAARVGGALGLLVRPFHEWGQLSAAGSRWCVDRHVTDGRQPRWRVQLMRCKQFDTAAVRESRLHQRGLDKAVPQIVQYSDQTGEIEINPGATALSDVIVEWRDGQGIISVSAAVVGGTGTATMAPSTADATIERHGGSAPARRMRRSA